jgi:LGFP repeat
VALNPVTNKIYVTNGGGGVTVIDGATNTTTPVTTGNTPSAVALNPVTNKTYVTNYNSNTVTVLTEQAVHTVPLQVAIAPLPGNSTSSSTPTFDLTATTTFTPSAPAIQGVAYQVDTWQGPWRTATATGGGGHFTATTPTLQPGVHILYAYATDAQAATSTNTGPQSSPLIGNITAYLFLVTPACPVVIGAIGVRYAELGGCNSSLGKPISTELPVQGGRYTQFEHGDIYWSPTTGAHEIYGAIRAAWASQGHETGPLGYPTTGEFDFLYGRVSLFQTGFIYWNPLTGPISLHW